MTDRAIKITAHSVLSQNQDLLRVVVKRGSSHLQLYVLKESGERGGAQGGSGKGKGMMFLPQHSTGSGWGVEL